MNVRILIAYFFFCCLYQLAKSQQDSGRYELIRLNINSNSSDFGPFMYNKTLYFSSGREHELMVKYYNENANAELTDIFTAEKKDSSRFRNVQPLISLNTKYNDGPVCLGKNGNKIYFTSADAARKNDNGQNPLSIFVSERTGNEWGRPTVLPFCKGKYNYAHPALMNDDRTLVFASDREDSYGRSDIYSISSDGNSEPIHFGKNINSDSADVFPFVWNNTLYFSSSRKGGTGGLDFYSADISIKKEKAEALDYPFNSGRDDFGIWMDSTQSEIYISSNRNGDDDIYCLKNKFPDFENCTPHKEARYCYTFYEEATEATQDTSGTAYEWTFGDGTKARGYEVKHCFEKPGTYNVELNIVEKSSGTVFYNQLSYPFTVEEVKRLYIDSPDSVAVNTDFTADAKRSVIPGYSIKKTYWFFGDKKFSSEITATHHYEKQGTFVLRMGAIAKNDSSGKEEKFCTEKKIKVMPAGFIAAKKQEVKNERPSKPAIASGPYKLIIPFDRNNAIVGQEYYHSLDSLVNVLKEQPKMGLIVVAIYDNSTDKEKHNEQAKERASVLWNYFDSKDIDDNRFDINIFGEKNPDTANSPKNIVNSNRRVEILLVETD